MKFSMKYASALVALITLSTGCAADTDASEPDGDEISDDSSALYSGWYNIGIFEKPIAIRVCQTSSVVRWQFSNPGGYYKSVRTSASNISAMTTYIAGVTSGTKYRTKNGPPSYFRIEVSAGNGYFWSVVFPDANHIPTC